MTLDNALKLVRSGGCVTDERGKVELSERRGVLFLTVKNQDTITSEEIVRALYWREIWVAK
jgi:hypothetical protein